MLTRGTDQPRPVIVSVVLAVFATLVVATLAPAQPAAAASGRAATDTALPATITITGHGYGHGRGMGQWGAYGYAVTYGWNAAQILDHFYGNTTAGTVDDTTVRIRLTELSAGGAHLATGTDYPATIVTLDQGTIGVDAGQGATDSGAHAVQVLRTGSGTFALSVGSTCAGPWSAPLTVPAGTVKLLPADPNAESAAATLALCEPSSAGFRRHVQGQVWTVDTGAKAITVNALPVEDYVKAVVPHEMPPSWGTAGTNNAGFAALEAQAVAVRSYGLASNAGAYDTCDWACQTYLGRWLDVPGASTPVDLTNNLTTLATALTAGQVRERNGAVMATEYSASTGGWTAGGTFPAVEDLGDAVAGNPNHDWSVTVARSAIEAAQGKGALTAIAVTSRNGLGADGGRVDDLTLSFTGGTVTLSGYQFQSLLGLRSNWFSIVQPCASTSAPLPPFASVTAMVAQQYLDLLDRSPDAGSTGWAELVTCQGWTGGNVAAAILASPEAQGSFDAIVRLYEGMFARAPDAAGVLYWRHQLTLGLPIGQVTSRLVDSGEFRAVHDAQTNAAFVASIYQQMLGRVPDASGGPYWTAQLDGGTPRATLVGALASTGEFRTHWAAAATVNEVYIGLLRRTADAAGASYWLGRLHADATAADVVSAIYGSAEYAARF